MYEKLIIAITVLGPSIIIFIILRQQIIRYHGGRDTLREIADVLGLKKAALVSSHDLARLYEIVAEARNTSMSEYEPVVYVKKVDEIKVYSAANKQNIKFWLEAPNNLGSTRIVLDATKNDEAFGSNLATNKFPSETCDLEGDFPDYFKLYFTPGSQVAALQIMAPDVMLEHVEGLPEFDLEINNKTIGIIADFKDGTPEMYRKYEAMLVNLALTVKELKNLR